MFRRLPAALAAVKAGNTSKKLLNVVDQIKYSLYQASEISGKVYNKIKNSRTVQYKMDTIFLDLGNSKTSDPNRLLLIY